MRTALAVFFCLFSLLGVSVGLAAEKRVALVIGNGAYTSAVALPNPANDAADMSAKLAELGFTVITGIDQTHDELESSLRRFALEARDARVALFFYSGHGIQVGGRNYIIPIDARLEDATALDFETIDAERVFSYMSGDGRIALAFLDACRDNPLSRRFAQSLPKSRSGAVGVGLAMPQTLGTGLFIGFSTSPGDVALDGDGRNSPFTAALLNHIAEPGLEIQQVMTRVKSDVQVATRGDQRPWTNSDLSAEVYLVPAVAKVPVAVPDPAPVTTSVAKPDIKETPADSETPTTAAEQFGFTFAQSLDTVAGWNAFIAAYPESRLLPLAEAAIKSLEATTVATLPAIVEEEAPPEDARIAELIAKAQAAYGGSRYDEAVQHYSAAAALGSAVAKGDLAYLTEQGLGTSRNPSRAVELYLEAIAGGNNAASYNYGWMLERGEGIARSPTEAARRLVESLAGGEATTRRSILEALLRDVGNLSTDTRRALQQELKDRGLYTGGIDGAFGQGSRGALTRLAEGT